MFKKNGLLLAVIAMLIAACGVASHSSTLHSRHANTTGTITLNSKVTYCCEGYWSGTYADFELSYENKMLPAGSSVLIDHGWKTDGEPGQAPKVIKASPIGASKWQAKLPSKQIMSRGGPVTTHLNFVLVITLPNGTVVYDKGSATNFSYYEAAIPDYNAACNRGEEGSCLVKPVVVVAQ